jgi:hypothetical protein
MSGAFLKSQWAQIWHGKGNDAVVPFVSEQVRKVQLSMTSMEAL